MNNKSFRKNPVYLAPIIALMCVQALEAQSPAQSTVQTQPQPNTILGGLPYELQVKASALGNRLYKPGHERVTITGTLQRNGTSIPAVVIFELPSKVKISFGANQVLGFDGTSSWFSGGSIASSDQDLLEAFSDDSPEAFFFSIAQQTHLFRPLVRYCRMDDGTTPNYSGPWVDIYQQVGVVLSRGDGTARQKHFYFDSTTELPDRVRYILAAGNRVEVVRSQWTQYQGQYVPLQISRYQDGQVTHSLTGTSVTVGAYANDGTFSH